MPVTPVEISQLWRHVNREMRALFQRSLGERDLPPFSFLLLRRIEEEPGITLTELARRVGSSKSHTSTVVDQLASEGYVEKRSDPADQRVVRLHVTRRAECRFERLDERAGELWAALMQEMPETDIQDVERFLRTLLSALERVNSRTQAGGPLAGGAAAAQASTGEAGAPAEAAPAEVRGR